MPTTSSPISSRRSRGSRRGWALALWLGLASLLALLAFTGRGEDTPEDVLFDPDLAVGGVVFYGVLVGITIAIAFVYRRPRRALGFARFDARWLWAALGLVVFTVVLSVALEPILHAGEEQGFASDEWKPERAGVFVANAIITAALGPFAEELFFRGLGVRVLATFGVAPAVLVSALLFGLVHGLLVALPTLVVFGLGLAWLRIRSRSLWPAIIAHAGYNGTGLLLLVLSWAVDVPAQ
jgi:membrane protease YdiL (CAAX protease family)